LKEIFPEIFQGAYTPFLNLDIVPPGGGYPGGPQEDLHPTRGSIQKKNLKVIEVRIS
jgi:hypothetical protein